MKVYSKIASNVSRERSKLIDALQKTRPVWWRRLNQTLAAGSVLVLCNASQAATFVFNPGAGSGTVTDPQSWQGGVAPVSGPSVSIQLPASFDSATSSGPTLDFDAPLLSVGNIVVTRIVAGGEVNLTSASSTVTVDSITIAESATLKAGSGIDWKGGNAGLVFNSGGAKGTAVISGAVGGVQGISVQGGEVTLEASNTYTGGTTVAGGKLVVGLAGNLGTGSALTVKNGGSLVLKNSASATSVTIEGGEIVADTGAESLTVKTGIRVNVATGVTAKIGAVIREGAAPVSLSKDGVGRLVISSSNAYNGDTTINSGVVEVAGVGVFGGGKVVLNGGVLTADSGPQSVANDVQVNAPVQLGETGAGVLTLSGNIAVSGQPITVVDQVTMGGAVTGKLVLSGPGNLTLSGASSELDTVLNGGVLTVGDAGALADLTAPAHGTLAINGGVLDVNTTLVNLRGLTLTGGAVVDNRGGGGIRIGGNSAVQVDANIPAGGSVSVGVPITEDTANNTVVSVRKRGEGRLVLSGQSDYTGDTLIEKGAVVLGANTAGGVGPVGASSSKVALAGGSLEADGGPRSIDNIVEVRSGASSIGGSGSVITVGRLEFQPGASVTVNGKLSSSASVDLNGGKLQFGSRTTGGKTTLEVPSLSAAVESVLSFTKDTQIIANGGNLSFDKVQLEVSPEALAAIARTHSRSGVSSQQILATSVGGAPGSVTLPISSSDVTGSSAAIRVSVGLTGAAVDPGVYFQSERKSYESLAASPNTREFAGVLDKELGNQLGNGSNVAQLMDKLDALASGGDVEHLLRIANGGPTYASVYNVATKRIQRAGSQLESHLDSLAAVSGSDRVYSFGVSRRGDGPTMLTPTGGGQSREQGKWTAWTSGYASESRMDGDSNLAGDIRARDQGAGIGAERVIGDLRVGVITQIGKADASFDSAGRLDSDHWSAGGFASVAIGSIVLDASAMYGTADNKISRYNGLGTVQGDFSSHDTQIGVGVAMNLAPASSQWQVTPVARLKHLSYTQEAFSERGAGFLDVDRMSEGEWSTKLGLRFGRRAETGKSVAFSLDGGAYWVHDYDSNGKSLNLRVSGTGSTFSATGVGSNADSVQLNLGAQVTFSDAYYIHLGGQQDFGGNRSQSAGVLSVGVSF